LNFYSYPSSECLWDLAFNEFKGTIWVRDLDDTHFRHKSSNNSIVVQVKHGYGEA